MMKILLAIDGSSCSEAVVEAVATRIWSPDTRVRIITVVETPFVPVSEKEGYYAQFQETTEKAAHNKGQAVIDKAVASILSGENKALRITAKVLKGSPSQIILYEAEQWDADLIFVGSHGYTAAEQAYLGSVSQVVATHAKCSVEIVRRKKRSEPEAPPEVK